MGILSVYLAPEHHDNERYVRAIKPNVVRILEPDVSQIASAYSWSPNSIFMPRYWWLDDSNRHQYREMVRNPVETARRHAAEWNREINKLRQQAKERNLTLPDKFVVTGVNEPDTNESEAQTVEYNYVFLSELAEYGLAGGALCLSVGHPTQLDDKGNVVWDAYMRLAPVIEQGKHYVVLHEYWQQEGPFHGEDYGYLFGRHKHCPFNAPIIIGEAGIDGAIYNRHSRNIGWNGLGVSPESYAQMVKDACNSVDDRVVGVCLFLTDYRDDNWKSFDTMPAHEQLINIVDDIKETKVAAWGKPPKEKPETVYVPVVNTNKGPEWERCIAWLLKEEGGFQNNPKDTGNYYRGDLIGTKYGISAASWAGQYDIPNLTLDEAKGIYFEHYWKASGADKLPWPLSLLVFDTSVLHGVGAAQAFLRDSGPNPFHFAHRRIIVYTGSDKWSEFGRGWLNRLARLLREVGS